MWRRLLHRPGASEILKAVSWPDLSQQGSDFFAEVTCFPPSPSADLVSTVSTNILMLSMFRFVLLPVA